jgi:hypothetical protein
MKPLILIAVLMLSACTNRGAYEAMQASERFECHKVPTSQYDECMEKLNTSYEQYERERRGDSAQ